MGFNSGFKGLIHSALQSWTNDMVARISCSFSGCGCSINDIHNPATWI